MDPEGAGDRDFDFIPKWRFDVAWLLVSFMLTFAADMFWAKDLIGSSRRTALSGECTFFLFLFSSGAYAEIVRLLSGEFAGNISPAYLRRLFHACMDHPGVLGQALRNFFLSNQVLLGIFMACFFAEFDSVCLIEGAKSVCVRVPVPVRSCVTGAMRWY